MMLEVNELSCGYGMENIVKKVSFDCDRGECLAIIGPNGCGKTTLLRALAGFISYTGSATVTKKEISGLRRKELSSKIALMTQITNTYFSYTVFESVALGRYLHQKGSFFQTNKKEEDEIVLSCLADVGLLECRNRPITTLSGGELQRVFLARVFAQNPQIIILDEPTNHLDLRYQIELVQRLKLWVKEKDRAIIGVLHDLNLAMELSQKVMLMENGSTVAFGDTNKVLNGCEINRVYGVNVQEYMANIALNWS